MLRIKEDVNLKELEKFGFKYREEMGETHDYLYGSHKRSFYTEKKYIYDDGFTTIEILSERKNSDWNHCNEIRQIWFYESDYDMQISNASLDLLYDLIQAGLVEKCEVIR